MHAAVRPHTAAGVALLAASALAVAPLTPPMPDVQATVQRAVSSAEVELAAAVNPLESLTQLVLASANNVTAIGGQFLNDPAPILGQLITNQGANAAVLGPALQSAIAFYQDFLPTIPDQLKAIADQLAAGQIADAVNATFQLPLGLALGLVFALPAVNEVVVNSAQNFANVVAALGDPNTSPLVTLALGAVTPAFAATSAFGAQAQDVFDSVKGGDLADAVGAALSIPSEVTNGLLNGFGDPGNGVPGDVQSPGLLTPAGNLGGFGPGLVASLLKLRDTVADALQPVGAATAVAALAAPAAKPATVSLKADVMPKALESATPDAKTDATVKDATTTKDATTKDATTTKADTGTKDASVAGDSTTKSVKADTGGKHRAQTDNPVSSAVKKFRDSVKKASSEPKHAKAESTSAK